MCPITTRLRLLSRSRCPRRLDSDADANAHVMQDAPSPRCKDGEIWSPESAFDIILYRVLLSCHARSAVSPGRNLVGRQSDERRCAQKPCSPLPRHTPSHVRGTSSTRDSATGIRTGTIARWTRIQRRLALIPDDRFIRGWKARLPHGMLCRPEPGNQEMCCVCHPAVRVLLLYFL